MIELLNWIEIKHGDFVCPHMKGETLALYRTKRQAIREARRLAEANPDSEYRPRTARVQVADKVVVGEAEKYKPEIMI